MFRVSRKGGKLRDGHAARPIMGGKVVREKSPKKALGERGEKVELTTKKGEKEICFIARNSKDARK